MVQKQNFAGGDNKQIFEITSLEIRGFLEELSEPVLLINLTNGSVISANSQFAEFFHIGVGEISGRSIFEFLPNIDLKNFDDGEKINLKFLYKNNQPLVIDVRPKIINQGKKILLLVLEVNAKHIAENNQSRIIFSKEQTEALSRIQEITYIELLEKIIKLGELITSFEDIVLYLKDENSKNLKQFSIKANNFPDQIPEMELNRITEINFWEPGVRVLSEIHRVGRLNKILSIITIPIFMEEQPFGFFIAATKVSRGNGIDNELLNQFSCWISTVLYIFNKLQSEKINILNEYLEKEKLELFSGNTNDGLIIIDEKNMILEFNTNFLRIFGFLPMEVLNKNINQLFGNSPFMTLINTPIAMNETEMKPLQMIDRNGIKKDVQGKVINFYSNKKNRKMIILKDETEIVSLKNSLINLQKTAVLGEILAEFSHDVRNIVNRLTTGLQLIIKRINPDEPTLSNIQDLQNECINITDLLESVLSYSRQNDDNFQPINLNEMIGRIFYRYQNKAKNSNISLIMNNTQNDYFAWGDQRSLERALNNLLNNSIEAIGTQGGAVSVNLSESSEKSDFTLLQIADTGPGIPPEIENNLYKKFMTGKKEGTGLGLFISKKIIESHKGWIDLETFPGGTIFNIYLPTLKRGESQ